MCSSGADGREPSDSMEQGLVVVKEEGLAAAVK